MLSSDAANDHQSQAQKQAKWTGEFTAMVNNYAFEERPKEGAPACQGA
jgi:hypothetical protein